MDSLTGAIDPQVVLVITAIAVSLLSVMLLIRILKAGAGLILTILAIVLAVQYFFGISFDQLLSEITNLPQEAIQFVQNFDLSNIQALISN